MRVLIACEFSGVVRDAFIQAGHDAISCDYSPSESPGPHLIGDVRPHLLRSWDLVIAHPPCQYLALSGVQYLHKQPGRWERMREAAAFFLDCLAANAPRVAVENPTMHGYAREIIGRPDCAVHPYHFGEAYSKRTCFWLRGLPPLLPTAAGDRYSDPLRWHTTTSQLPQAARARERSRFSGKMAQAMARQWGSL